MAFATGHLNDIQGVQGGELLKESQSVILTANSFQNNLRAGRFARWNTTTNQLQNLNGTNSSLNLAGVVTRDLGAAIEDGDQYKTASRKSVNYIRSGLAVVDVLSTVTPSFLGTVYALSYGNDNDGLATTSAANSVKTNAIFIRETRAGAWIILLTPSTVSKEISDVTALATMSFNGTTVANVNASLTAVYTAVRTAVNAIIAAGGK